MSEIRNDYEILDIMSEKERITLSEIRRFEIISSAQLAHLLVTKKIEGEQLVYYLTDLIERKKRVLLTNDNNLVCADAKDVNRAIIKCIWPILENSVIEESSNEEEEDDNDDEKDSEAEQEKEKYYYSPYGIKARFPLDIELTCKAEYPAGFICYGKENQVLIFTPIENHCESVISFLQERYYARQIVREKNGETIIDDTVINLFVTDNPQITKEIFTMKNIRMPYVVCEVTKKMLDNGMPNIKYYFPKQS